MQIPNLETRVASLEAVQAQINERLGSIESRLTSLETRMDNRLTSIENRQASNFRWLVGIQAYHTYHARHAHSVQTRITQKGVKPWCAIYVENRECVSEKGCNQTHCSGHCFCIIHLLEHCPFQIQIIPKYNFLTGRFTLSNKKTPPTHKNSCLSIRFYAYHKLHTRLCTIATIVGQGSYTGTLNENRSAKVSAEVTNSVTCIILI